jgi:hypothetical protein
VRGSQRSAAGSGTLRRAVVGDRRKVSQKLATLAYAAASN